MNESHVEHAVGFIQHADAHLVELEHALLGQIEQPPRGGDEDIAAAAQCLDLRALADAAEDHHGAQLDEATVVLGAGGDLGGELARGREHQSARRAALGCAQVLQDRQHERRRLAGAGLRAREHVAAGEHRRNGLALDGSGNGVAFFGHSTGQLGLQPEFCK